MSTTAGGGGPGPGPMGSFKSIQPVKQPTVMLAVAAGIATIYAFWEMRVRAAQKMGLTPRTINPEWQAAEADRLRHMNFESNPHKFVYMNPFRNEIPSSKAVWTE